MRFNTREVRSRACEDNVPANSLRRIRRVSEITHHLLRWLRNLRSAGVSPAIFSIASRSKRPPARCRRHNMTKLKATEQRNPRTRGIDAKSTIEILRAIHREDASVARAVLRALPAIARAVDAIAGAIQQGGRLFYVGAGTSGRLAALDAAELPPTFGTPPRMVQAMIAGGRRALTHAVEGAEDNRAQGAKDLSKRADSAPKMQS